MYKYIRESMFNKAEYFFVLLTCNDNINLFSTINIIGIAYIVPAAVANNEEPMFKMINVMANIQLVKFILAKRSRVFCS